MEQAGGYQATVAKLYALYKERGFLREEEALDMMTADTVSLVDINRVTDRLIALGVIFADDSTADDDEDIDRARTDYEAIFKKILLISPGQAMLVDYIRNVRPPQNREWRLLITQMNSGNEYAFSRLFDMYLRVVLKIALRFFKDEGFELDDAIQEGSLGLIRGIQQYDCNRHGNLGSYIPLWIQQFISRAVVDKGSTIRIPVHAYDLMQRINRIRLTLSERNSCEPTHDEIAAMVETPVSTVRKLCEVTQETCSYDAMIEDDDGRSEIETRYYLPSIEDEMENEMMKEQIHTLLLTLTNREQRVIGLRYGLFDDKERTLEEVGAVFKVTRERIRQIEAKAFRKLKHPSRRKYLKDFDGQLQ